MNYFCKSNIQFLCYLLKVMSGKFRFTIFHGLLLILSKLLLHKEKLYWIDPESHRVYFEFKISFLINKIYELINKPNTWTNQGLLLNDLAVFLFNVWRNPLVWKLRIHQANFSSIKSGRDGSLMEQDQKNRADME